MLKKIGYTTIAVGVTLSSLLPATNTLAIEQNNPSVISSVLADTIKLDTEAKQLINRFINNNIPLNGSNLSEEAIQYYTESLVNNNIPLPKGTQQWNVISNYRNQLAKTGKSTDGNFKFNIKAKSGSWEDVKQIINSLFIDSNTPFNIKDIPGVPNPNNSAYTYENYYAEVLVKNNISLPKGTERWDVISKYRNQLAKVGKSTDKNFTFNIKAEAGSWDDIKQIINSLFINNDMPFNIKDIPGTPDPNSPSYTYENYYAEVLVKNNISLPKGTERWDVISKYRNQLAKVGKSTDKNFTFNTKAEAGSWDDVKQIINSLFINTHTPFNIEDIPGQPIPKDPSYTYEDYYTDVLVKNKISLPKETQNWNVMKKYNVKIRSNTDIKNLFSFSGDAKQIGSRSARLTSNDKNLKGSISGTTTLDMREDFNLDLNVDLGKDKNGGDGIAVAFHQGEIGELGAYGGGLGALGLKKGIAFELDTFWNAKKEADSDTSYRHNEINQAHAGFVATDKNPKALKALAPMQNINAYKGNLKISWNAKENLLIASYDGKTWILKNPDIDKSRRYTFSISSATGAHTNEHYVTVNDFNAAFDPILKGKNININAGGKFNPYDSSIGLNAYDALTGENLTKDIKVSFNNVNTSRIGQYSVTYSVKNSAGKMATLTICVKVEWGNPSISGKNITIPTGEKFDPFDPRINLRAYEAYTGKNITDNIKVIRNDVKPSKQGTYTVVYDVEGLYGTSSQLTLKVEVLDYHPQLDAKNLSLHIGDKFDSQDERIGLKAYDPIEKKDITDKIQLISSNVNTEKYGSYEATYKVTNNQGYSTTKTIQVKVLLPDTRPWSDGTDDGWKMFSGEKVIPQKNAEAALDGDYTFYADQAVSLYKSFNFYPDETYKVVVYVKSAEPDTTFQFIKASLKGNSASNTSDIIFNNRIVTGEESVNGYYRFEGRFTATRENRNSILVIESYGAAYIGSINVIAE
ncbi:immunoglobulin-like domain-containing protein [Listeria sp. PSOL-1]|uniref:lectin-like domain-containing protein n=1 Tax=Listeria sp. PSOL-1 TaxID=1844999 RepID=UPI0013D15002|nr:immunoglobulin-like domain-containing protein [Listeria sp. PSOL-1]